MVAVGDIIRLDVKQIYQIGAFIEMHNVFFYEVATLTGSLTLFDDGAELGVDWDSAIGTKIRATQHSLLYYNSIKLDNCTDPDDFGAYIYPDAVTGGASGEPAPSFNAWSFELIRTTRATRNGSKRIGGISDGWTTGNTVYTTFIPTMTACALALQDPFAWTNGTASAGLRPVITRMPGVGLTPLAVNRVNDAVFRKVSTQRTRLS